MRRFRALWAFIFLALVTTCLGAQAVPSESSRAPTPEEIQKLEVRAATGDPAAQVALGGAYEEGDGVTQSDSQAAKWYRAAADQGDGIGQNRLGTMYSRGRGVQQDKKEAFKWYSMAAKQKNPSAAFNVGMSYYNGDGVDIDDILAYAWFSLAKSLGDISASEAIDHLTKGPTVPCRAFEKMGDIFQKGEDLPQSTPAAIEWYRKAAGAGIQCESSSAEVKLASLLLSDKSKTPNYADVLRLCERAARLHSGAGAYCVGLIYSQGLGVAQDFTKAAKWMGDAADTGHAKAALQLGQMYWKGEGVKKDKISAYEFISLAQAAGLPDAKGQKELLEKELTPEELRKGNAKVAEWTSRHALAIKGKTVLTN